MYCNHCGNELPKDSNFCVHCGKELTPPKENATPSSSINLNFNFNIIGDVIVGSIKSPINSITKFIKSLTPTFILIYFVVASLIYALIGSLSIRLIGSSAITKFMKSLVNLQGTYVGPEEIAYALNTVNSYISSVFPFKTLFWWLLLGTILFYGGLILLTLLIHTVVYKSKVNITNYIVIALVALNLQIAFLIITILCSYLSIYLAEFILIISTLTVLIVLYRGFTSLVSESSLTPYLWAVTYAIANILSSYVIFQLIKDHLVKLSASGFLNNIFNSFW